MMVSLWFVQGLLERIFETLVSGYFGLVQGLFKFIQGQSVVCLYFVHCISRLGLGISGLAQGLFGDGLGIIRLQSGFDFRMVEGLFRLGFKSNVGFCQCLREGWFRVYLVFVWCFFRVPGSSSWLRRGDRLLLLVVGSLFLHYGLPTSSARWQW